jgi:amino acid adenylation domain-containing protein
MSLAAPYTPARPQGAWAELSATDLLAALAERGVGVKLRRGTLQLEAEQLLTQSERALVTAREGELVRTVRERSGVLGPELTSEPTHARFALTALQQAYLVGELGYSELRTRAHVAHAYEVPALDVARLGRAVRALLQRHELLRTVPTDDGEQTVLALDPHWNVHEVDVRELSLTDARSEVERGLQTAGDVLPALSVGPQLACVVYRAAECYFVLLVVRLFALDARALGLVYRDLGALYEQAAGPADVATVSPGLFARYVAALERHRGTQSYRNALAYWRRRATELPAGPALPELATRPEQARFARRSHRLSATSFRRLGELARRLELSESAVLCALYAEVLRRWSTRKTFSLTVLASTRAMVSGDDAVADHVGNYGTTFLLTSDGAGATFVDKVRSLHTQLLSDLSQCWVSAVEVLRQLRSQADESVANVPYVFASGLHVHGSEALPARVQLPNARLLGKSMHTPQVLLDHQVFEDDGELVCNFDFVPAAFPAGLMDELTSHHADLLELLVHDETAWRAPLPELAPQLLAAREARNDTARQVEEQHVLSRFAAHASEHPHSAALLGRETFSYAATRSALSALAGNVRAHAIDGELVGILAEKGTLQYLAALGIVAAGSAYLPLNLDWPRARIAQIVSQAGLRIVLADRSGSALLADPDLTVLSLEQALAHDSGDFLMTAPHPESTAYVIFTSGSTGVPKGVVIPHAGLANTVVDVAERFSFSAADRILSLSELNFDLSAFDLFGALHVGAAVVIPEHARRADPEHWTELVEAHGVTVWNTVPALMEMFLDYLGPRAAQVLGKLRLVMLSGDWIPLTLPERIRSACPTAHIVSLGGATEASIWSNYYSIEQIADSWTSIPYGYPLANQTLHVLDDDLQDAPSWVPGELYIGGRGVACGYLAQPELSAARFVLHPRSGERLYRTGDFARFWPDGTVEFLGRKDSQAKLRGYRIDLLEIEKQLTACAGIRAAACVIRGQPPHQSLVALLVLEPGQQLSNEFSAVLQRELGQVLPHYAVPASFLAVDKVPLSDNGKRDTSALLALAERASNESRATRRGPSSDLERALWSIWRELCGRDVPSVDSDFFAVGGSSLLAVTLLRRVQERLAPALSLSMLFHARTIEKQAQCIEHLQKQAPDLLVELREGGAETLVLVHPVGGHVLCYRDLVAALAPGFTVIGVASPASHALPESLEQLARHYATLIAARVAGRPFALAGWSMGGVLAAEIARCLEARGLSPRALTLIDSFASPASLASAPSESQQVRAFLADHMRASDLTDLPGELSLAVALLQQRGLLPAQLSGAALHEPFALYRSLYALLVRHVPGPAPRCATRLIHAQKGRATRFAGLAPAHEQPAFAHAALEAIDADHYSIMEPEQLAPIATWLSESLHVSSPTP